jgi:hypothetical protein
LSARLEAEQLAKREASPSGGRSTVQHRLFIRAKIAICKSYASAAEKSVAVAIRLHRALSQYALVVGKLNAQMRSCARTKRHVIAAFGGRPLPDQNRVRELVDDASFSSGWFFGFGTLRIFHSDYRKFADKKRRFLRKTLQFRDELAEFFGEPDIDPKEPYDPWGEWRHVVPALDDLAKIL